MYGDASFTDGVAPFAFRFTKSVQLAREKPVEPACVRFCRKSLLFADKFAVIPSEALQPNDFRRVLRKDNAPRRFAIHRHRFAVPSPTSHRSRVKEKENALCAAGERNLFRASACP